MSLWESCALSILYNDCYWISKKWPDISLVVCDRLPLPHPPPQHLYALTLMPLAPSLDSWHYVIYFRPLTRFCLEWSLHTIKFLFQISITQSCNTLLFLKKWAKNFSIIFEAVNFLSNKMQQKCNINLHPGLRFTSVGCHSFLFW